MVVVAILEHIKFATHFARNVYHCIPLYTSSTLPTERLGEEGGCAANVVQTRGKKQVETGSIDEKETNGNNKRHSK